MDEVLDSDCSYDDSDADVEFDDQLQACRNPIGSGSSPLPASPGSPSAIAFAISSTRFNNTTSSGSTTPSPIRSAGGSSATSINCAHERCLYRNSIEEGLPTQLHPQMPIM